MLRHNPIVDIFNVIFKAKKIREDEERKAKFCGFAITSIIYSVLMVAFAVGAGYLMGLMETEAAALAIFVIVGFVGCLLGVAISFLGGLLRVIAQLIINRKVIGWIALALFIAATAVSVYLVISIPGMV